MLASVSAYNGSDFFVSFCCTASVSLLYPQCSSFLYRALRWRLPPRWRFLSRRCDRGTLRCARRPRRSPGRASPSGRPSPPGWPSPSPQLPPPHISTDGKWKKIKVTRKWSTYIFLVFTSFIIYFVLKKHDKASANQHGGPSSNGPIRASLPLDLTNHGDSGWFQVGNLPATDAESRKAVLLAIDCEQL